MAQPLNPPPPIPGAEPESNPRPARILDAANRCFSEKGFQSTTIIDVADAAGVSRPLIYKYFGDKDGLIESVLRVTFADWERLNAALASPATDASPSPEPSSAAADALAAKIETTIDFVLQRPIFRAILQQDSQIVLRGHLEDLRRCRRVSAESTRAILRAGIASGELRGDLDEESTTASLEMILFGLLERALGLRPELALDPALVRTTLDLLLVGLRSTGRAS